MQIDQTSKTDEMLSFVDKYSTSFAEHVPSTASSPKDTVLITGTTGGLGTALLSELVASESIARIFAFNRKAQDGVSVPCRQQAALRAQGLDENLVYSPKVVMLEGDAGTGTLGLPFDILETVCWYGVRRGQSKSMLTLFADPCVRDPHYSQW